MIIKAKKIYCEDGIKSGYLVVKEGKIKGFSNEDQQAEIIDYSDYTIIPGIFDTHNHGTMGYSLMGSTDSDTKTEIHGYLKGLAAQGVTSIFPTADYHIFKDIVTVAVEQPRGAKIVGIHSEGPYLSRVGEKGVDNGHPDVDMDQVKKMVEDSKGTLKLVAIAPEIKGSDEAIKYLTSKGVKVAFAHSDCNYAQANEAFSKGITVATHTANVMSGIHHRNMGGLGACLLNENVDCEVICDCLHVSAEMLEIMFRVKDYSRFMMISDCTPTSGAPVGRYDFGLFGPVNVSEEGFCLTDTGRLAGSTKPVIYGIKCLVEKLHIPLETVTKMASLNPCRVYGLAETKGSIKVGKDADFVVIDNDFNVIATYVEGKKVYDNKTDLEIFNKEYTNKYRID